MWHSRVVIHALKVLRSGLRPVCALRLVALSVRVLPHRGADWLDPSRVGILEARQLTIKNPLFTQFCSTVRTRRIQLRDLIAR